MSVCSDDAGAALVSIFLHRDDDDLGSVGNKLMPSPLGFCVCVCV